MSAFSKIVSEVATRVTRRPLERYGKMGLNNLDGYLCLSEELTSEKLLSGRLDLRDDTSRWCRGAGWFRRQYVLWNVCRINCFLMLYQGISRAPWRCGLMVGTEVPGNEFPSLGSQVAGNWLHTIIESQKQIYTQCMPWSETINVFRVHHRMLLQIRKLDMTDSYRGPKEREKPTLWNPFKKISIHSWFSGDEPLDISAIGNKYLPIWIHSINHSLDSNTEPCWRGICLLSLQITAAYLWVGSFSHPDGNEL